jgi:putative ABC transport system permease protein
MFMTAINVKDGWEANIAKVYETRSYDVEVQLASPPSAELEERLQQLSGVRNVEAWGFSPTTFAVRGELDVVHTYPDRGHGGMVMMGVPPTTELIRFSLKAGRWLNPQDSDAVVLNHVAYAQAGMPQLGALLTLSLDAKPTRWRLVGVVEEIGSPGSAYVTDEAFAQASGQSKRGRLLRITTSSRDPEERAKEIRTIEGLLDEARVGVDSVTPLAELRTSVGEHIVVLIRMLIALAMVLAAVGTLGLGSTMGTSVVERTRELGILKALGATPGQIVKLLLTEGAAIGAFSWVLAIALCIPLTLLVDSIVGNLGFLSALPWRLSPSAVSIWLGLVAAVSLIATLLPARRAAGLVIREALVQP